MNNKQIARLTRVKREIPSAYQMAEQVGSSFPGENLAEVFDRLCGFAQTVRGFLDEEIEEDFKRRMSQIPYLKEVLLTEGDQVEGGEREYDIRALTDQVLGYDYEYYDLWPLIKEVDVVSRPHTFYDDHGIKRLRLTIKESKTAKTA